jgi:hypothetical protein
MFLRNVGIYLRLHTSPQPRGTKQSGKLSVCRKKAPSLLGAGLTNQFPHTNIACVQLVTFPIMAEGSSTRSDTESFVTMLSEHLRTVDKCVLKLWARCYLQLTFQKTSMSPFLTKRKHRVI